jgi:hypothetical protein
MYQKEELIHKIIEIEWEMFSSVRNRGGKASCQEQPEVFKAIRSSNFLYWSEATLKSYWHDLLEAQKQKRNLMTEKYARMEGMIPSVDMETASLIDKIVKQECQWLEDIAMQSPHLKPVRPIHSVEDSPYVVSSETYSRGELATYSKKTLELYLQDVLDMAAKKMNRIELIFNTMSDKLQTLEMTS